MEVLVYSSADSIEREQRDVLEFLIYLPKGHQL
jgi:hypothetical protein